MNRFTIRLTCGLLAAAMAATSAPAMDTGASDDLKRQINVAGKQRMLSQRMARAVCFSAMEVLPASQNMISTKARDAFATALTGLRNGDANLDLPAERNEEVLHRLSAVDALWPAYRDALLAAEADRSALPGIVGQSTQMLKAANDVVMALESTVKIEGSLADLSRAINVAGRQRMLTQRAAKEFCLYAAGVDAAQQRAALQATVDLFDRSLEGLMQGSDDMGLIAAPDEMLMLQFEHVGQLWEPMRELFQAAIDGGAVGPQELKQVAAHIDQVLKAADEAVWFYENL